MRLWDLGNRQPEEEGGGAEGRRRVSVFRVQDPLNQVTRSTILKPQGEWGKRAATIKYD